MESIPEWLEGNKLWHKWFENLRNSCTIQEGKKKLIGQELVTIEKDQVLFTLKELSDEMQCSITSGMNFLRFLERNNLVEVKKIGAGRSQSNLITVK